MPRVRSSVWLDFTLQDQGKYKCNNCEFVCGANATRMSQHLANCDGYINSSQESSGSKKICVSSFVDKLTNKQQDDLQRSYAQAVFSTGSALHMFETPEWDKFFKKIRPAFVRPKRKVLLRKHVGLEKQRVLIEMQEAIEKSDTLVYVMDTSTVNKKCQLNIVLLTPKPYFVTTIDCGVETKNAEFMFKQIKPYIEKYGAAKTTAVVTDNAPNMRNIDPLLGREFKHVFSYGCLAHIMNNIMKKFGEVEEVAHVLEQAQSIVTEITKSTKKFKFYSNKVAQYCERENYRKFTLRSFSKTRFSGVKMLVSSVLKSKVVLREMAVTDVIELELSTESATTIADFDFWSKLGQIHDVVIPLALEIAHCESDSSRISRVQVLKHMLATKFLPSVEKCIERDDYDRIEKYVLQDQFKLMNVEFALLALKFDFTIDADPLNLNTREVDQLQTVLMAYAMRLGLEGMKVLASYTAFIADEDYFAAAAVERSFSMHKYVVAPRRNRLTEDHAKDLMFLKSNRSQPTQLDDQPTHQQEPVARHRNNQTKR